VFNRGRLVARRLVDRVRLRNQARACARSCAPRLTGTCSHTAGRSTAHAAHTWSSAATVSRTARAGSGTITGAYIARAATRSSSGATRSSCDTLRGMSAKEDYAILTDGKITPEDGPAIRRLAQTVPMVAGAGLSRF